MYVGEKLLKGEKIEKGEVVEKAVSGGVGGLVGTALTMATAGPLAAAGASGVTCYLSEQVTGGEPIKAGEVAAVAFFSAMGGKVGAKVSSKVGSAGGIVGKKVSEKAVGVIASAADEIASSTVQSLGQGAMDKVVQGVNNYLSQPSQLTEKNLTAQTGGGTSSSQASGTQPTGPLRGAEWTGTFAPSFGPKPSPMMWRPGFGAPGLWTPGLGEPPGSMAQPLGP
jgi:hypothetical protein